GLAEMSVFHGLLSGKGRRPSRLVLTGVPVSEGPVRGARQPAAKATSNADRARRIARSRVIPWWRRMTVIASNIRSSSRVVETWVRTAGILRNGQVPELGR